MPFCSKNCQRIDLAHWLSEEIGVPLDPSEGDPVREDSDQQTGLDEA